MSDEANPSELTPRDSSRWIGRIAIALLLAQGLWALIGAVTNSLILPLMARGMGGDPNSPTYLGTQDIIIQPIFVAVLELCLAGILAVMINSWVQRRPKIIRRKVIAPASIAPQVTASPRPADPAPIAAPAPAPAPPVVSTAPLPVAPVTPPAPAKPAPKKEVYYNLVGDPVEPDE